ncbi:MAG: hypothetical protein HYX32_02520 [Actinobacteria bacterium]|nr:hypothetical protein [Actinomycetota bacterium]
MSGLAALVFVVLVAGCGSKPTTGVDSASSARPAAPSTTAKAARKVKATEECTTFVKFGSTQLAVSAAKDKATKQAKYQDVVDTGNALKRLVPAQATSIDTIVKNVQLVSVNGQKLAAADQKVHDAAGASLRKWYNDNCYS